jgi:hypothetical protein
MFNIKDNKKYHPKKVIAKSKNIIALSLFGL